MRTSFQQGDIVFPFSFYPFSTFLAFPPSLRVRARHFRPNTLRPSAEVGRGTSRI